MVEEQCIFCHIVRGDIPAKKVFEDDKVLAVLDINPAVSGHILLLPKEHVAVMPQMKDELVGHMGMVGKQLSAALIRSMKVEGTSIFVANGAAAGQRAPHFMLHVIPRGVNDGVQLELEERKLDDKLMNAVFVKLAESVGKQLGFAPRLPVQGGKKEDVKPAKKVRDEPKSEEKVLPKSDALDDIATFLTRGKQ